MEERETMSQTATITQTRQIDSAKKSRHIREEPITWSNWYKHVNWLQTFILGTTPIIALYGLATTQLLPKTAVWSLIYYFATGTGITAGYHRLWAHRAYTASRPLQYVLLFVASGAVQGSLRWWCRDHRAHHRYTDTDRDPYSAHKGLLYSHIGWMILKQNPNVLGKTDISDLNSDWLIRAQHKYYGLFALFCGVLFPTLIPGLGWGDWRGGFYYSAILRLVGVHHATFCVNSLAHYLGDKPFDDKHTPRDHFITAVVTMGEGYHNFHHEFPQDYRNAIKFYQYDPTKWLIKTCSMLGLASNLKKFPENEIKKGQVYMQQKYLDAVKKTLDWGTPIDSLPVISFEDYQEKAKSNGLVLIEGIVYDVSTFMDEHPGGRGVLKVGLGKDMTTAFNGGVYDHSNAARNLMSKYRVAVVAGGGEVEHRKTK